MASVQFISLPEGLVLTVGRLGRMGSPAFTGSIVVPKGWDKVPARASTTFDDSNVKGDMYFLAEVSPDEDVELLVQKGQYTLVKFPPVTKEHRSLLTVGSKWFFSKDWEMKGYDYGSCATSTSTIIPKGTSFTVKSDKFEKTSTYSEYHDVLPVVTDSPILNSALTAAKLSGSWKWDSKSNVQFIPIREVMGFIELEQAGKDKVFWKIEYEDGTDVKSKRYNSLSAVKASVRLYVETSNIADGVDTDVPDWVRETAYSIDRDGDNPFDTSREFFAVKYDYATEKELDRENLNIYVTQRVLQTS